MDLTEVMRRLESMGTAQNRKVYARHGVGEKMFGVSFANLGKLRKAIRTDHDLALRLWATGNHDARILATMVADPERLDGRALDAWAKDLDNYVVTDAFSNAAARSPEARRKMETWTGSRREWIGTAGWNVLSRLALDDGDVPDAGFEPYVAAIESGLHGSPNRVRHAMNNALIAIGLRSGALEKKAVAAAKRIGKVEVDHGETGCKTPDAAAYIRKSKAHRRRKGGSS
jgi:3-methyladenine DNA glycosylase AlkD